MRSIVIALVLLFSAASAGADDKLPIPDEASQKEAKKLVGEVYKGDYEKAKTSAQRIALAKKLRDEGLATTDDAAARYALLDVAKNISAAAGDVKTALEIVDSQAERYKFDSILSKAAVLSKAVKSQRLPKTHQTIVPLIHAVLDEAIREDRFRLTKPLSELAVTSARKSRNPKLIKATRIRIKQLAAIEKQAETAKKALAILKENAEDPEANVTVGKYYCLIKDQWDKGLPYLARGSHEGLKNLAAAELAVGSDALALGDEWWASAAKQDKADQTAMKRRAVHWYNRVLPGLRGIQKTKVSRRIAELEEKKKSGRDDGTVVIDTAEDFEKLKFKGDYRIHRSGDLEFPNGEPASSAETKASYSFPIHIGYEAFCLPDGVLDLFPGFADIKVMLGLGFNKSTAILIGGKLQKISHIKLVPNKLYRVELLIDENRTLVVVVDRKEIFRKTLDKNVKLVGPVRLSGGIGHVVYKKVVIKGKKKK